LLWVIIYFCPLRPFIARSEKRFYVSVYFFLYKWFKMSYRVVAVARIGLVITLYLHRSSPERSPAVT
jgi:hypothetical protein